MRINLNLGCSLQAMKTMEDNSYDLAVVDPPYGLAEAGAYNHTSGRSKMYSDKMDKWDTRPSQEYFDQLFRVSKNQIIFGMNYFTDMIPPSRCFIVWDKHMRNKLSFSEAEIAYSSANRMSKIYTVSAYNSHRIHRCQKPVLLYHKIFHDFASPGMKILDTHLGSGSSAIAAWECGLKFDGWEINTEYYTAAVSRYNEYTKQTKLFT